MKSKEKYLLHDSGSETAPFSQFPSYITLFMRPGFTSQCPFAMVCLKIQGWPKKWSPGCEKFTGRSRQKWYAIAGEHSLNLLQRSAGLASLSWIKYIPNSNKSGKTS